MNKQDYIIRPYEKGDEFEINKRFNEVFGLKRPIEEWHWKFRPDIEASRIMVAVDEKNEVLAHYAATLVDMSIGGSVYKCGQPVDVYATKQKGSIQHRLYIKTVREFFKTFGAEDKMQLLFGFPSARVLKLGQMKLDYGDPEPVVVGNRQVSKRRLIFKKIPKKKDVNLASVEELWNRSSHRYSVSAVRNSDYIKKRYMDRPKNRYFYLSIENREQMKVFSVLEYNKFSIKWIDLIWDGEDTEHLLAMDELVEKLTRLAGVAGNEMWIANDPQVKHALEKRGWAFSPHNDLFLVAMSFHPDLDSGRFIKELYFTLGDSDLV